MARPSAFNVRFDIDQLSNFADKLSDLSPARVGSLLVDAINQTVDSAYELSRKAILRGINLSDDYVQQHMRVEHATQNNPTATIVAFGGKGHITSLSHYGAMQETQSAKTSRAKGDPARGISSGEKAAGLSVEVVQGSRKPIAHGFTMPGKKDKAGNLLVFTRDRGGKVKSRTGPSVYQLFRVAGALIEEQVADNLQDAVMDAAETEFLKELT